MPKIKIEKVISFSSEDPVHVANNILSSDPIKKWKCQTAGEKSANLVLQLEEAAVISNIDIGNENSAYIEVLVSRSGSTDDFKVFLVMSSFMSPLEARQSTNMNKVRMFSYNDLSAPERDEKWDRVKIVCTQPFNRHTQYGLSFINFHTSGKDEKTNTPHIGKFALRPESPNTISIGSLFARKKELQENKPLTDLDIPNVSRGRDEIFYAKDEEEPNQKIDAIIEQKQLEKQKLDEKKVEVKKTPKRNEEKLVKNEKKTPQASTSKDKAESSKRKLGNKLEGTPKKKLKKQLQRPFHQLFNDVVLVISGIQNPDRSNIRNMVIAMGGRYKADWDNTCTHLVCAFTNTPKFNQVKGKGKIVTKAWVTDCHAQRKRIPWRRYALDKNDKNKDESEEEILEEVDEVPEVPVQANDDNDDNRDNKSGSDTEDEIDRINTMQKLKGKNEEDAVQTKQNGKESTPPQSLSVFDQDTDEEDLSLRTGNDCPTLPDFFADLSFYIDDNLSTDEKKMLVKYITACNG
ncbi:dna-repair protein xrcc1 [Holotrichia oblita]|uniref:Dna-repair protein xrcc1 n=1 Tax=Holotrichia oblita TaxID=644536 RepID=A0ACB9T6U2_HOLOL|nr:dna-repair protein xrcc1 [Holotrichia oblita]